MLRKTIISTFVLIGLGGLGVLADTTFADRTLLSFLKLGQQFEITNSGLEIEQQSDASNSSRKISILPTEGNLSTVETSSHEIPEHILYGQVFDLVVKFKKLVDEQRLTGEDISAFEKYFEKEMSLTEAQGEDLDKISAEYVQAVSLVDAQAEIEIEQLRQQHQAIADIDGQLIKPSSELLDLQEQRYKLAIQYRDRLRLFLGVEKFTHVDQFLKSRFANGFRSFTVAGSQDDGAEGGVK